MDSTAKPLFICQHLQYLQEIKVLPNIFFSQSVSETQICCVCAAFFHSPCVSWVGQAVLKMSLVSAGVSSSYKAAFWVSFKNVGSKSTKSTFHLLFASLCCNSSSFESETRRQQSVFELILLLFNCNVHIHCMDVRVCKYVHQKSAPVLECLWA